MTGSPVTKNPLDLYSQCEFLDPWLLDFTSYYSFRNRYAEMKTKSLLEYFVEALLVLYTLLNRLLFVLPTEKLPLWRRVIYVICGYEPPTENTKAYEETQEHLLRFTSIKEDPRWKMFVDINCVVLILLVVFLWGFWA